MSFSRRHVLQLAASVALPLSHPGMAHAQAYPTRPVRIFVGLAAGGPTDVAARIMADWLSERLNQQFIVENRTGMAGNFAAEAMINAPADGHTLLFAGPNVTISVSLYKKLPFDFLRQAAPVGAMMRVPNVMVVPASLPVKSVREFIDYAKANPGKLSMASSGVGASPHLSGELFKFMAGIDMLHVPYRGSSAAYPDLISGRVHVLFDNLGGPVLALLGAGKLHALGVTTTVRSPALPDVPTIADTVPGYEVSVWYGLFAPRGTPPDAIATLNKAINEGLASPKILARITDGGGVPMPMSPAELDTFVRNDIDKWRKVIEAAKIPAE